jgi:acyl carrier protein
METVEEWDSVVNITLVNVVEEEFAVQIALEEIEEMLSFRRFLDYLKTKKVAVT